MPNEFKVSIWQSPWNHALDITFWEEREGRIYVAQPMEFVWKEAKEGYTTDSSLRISHFMAPRFLNALAEALDEHGVKTEKDATLKGMLDAQKYHLEDLRKLLRLKDSKNV